MFLEYIEVPHKRSRNKTTLISKMSCDSCGAFFERRGTDHADKKHHFCSLKCTRWEMRRFGLIDQSKRDHFKEKYGVTHNLNIDAIKKNANTEKAHEKRRITCVERYGADTPMRNEVVKEGRRQTCLEKYGVGHVFQVEVVKEKMRETFLERYGVVHPFRLPEVLEKRHQTAKNNLKLKTSNSEIKFGEFLTERFPQSQIEHHVIVKRYVVDFRIDQKLYVHFDGVYWHGLDRPLEVIMQFKNPRDEAIYTAYLKDRRQDVWFVENSLKFLRITDKEFIDDPEQVCIKIREKLKEVE